MVDHLPLVVSQKSAEVEEKPWAIKVVASYPSKVPVQSPVVTKVKAPLETVSPEPVKSEMASVPRLMVPPETLNPLDDERPPVSTPPEKVEVAVEVDFKKPN